MQKKTVMSLHSTLYKTHPPIQGPPSKSCFISRAGLVNDNRPIRLRLSPVVVGQVKTAMKARNWSSWDDPKLETKSGNVNSIMHSFARYSTGKGANI